MNKHPTLWPVFAASLVLVVFAGFYLSNASAETEAFDTPGTKNLVLGRLAFATVTGTFSGPQFGIRTANADGTGLINATNFPPANDPTWSPDGTKIVYVSFGAGSEIFVMDPNGTNQVNLTNTMDISETNPSWSVTGKIVYERDGQIWVMNADGSNQTQFPGITQPSPTDPAWSPDGGRIAFVSGGEIWKINADGTNEIRVTTNATADTDPAWSPDGTRIVLAKGGSGVAVVGADGTNEMNLTTIPGDVNPSWSSDGSTIAFRRGAAPAGIYLMDVTGGNQVRIIADTPGPLGTTNHDPVWQPIGQTPNTFTISGRITRNGASLQGTTVDLSGTTNAAATTDAAGNYQFSGLPAGGSFTVSPGLLNHYFTPPSRSFNTIDGNRIADFTASGVCVGLSCAQNGRIAFVRGTDIVTMNADGSDQTNITNSATNDSDPNYSPDGTQIVFTTNRDGNNEIYRMNADGGSPIRLTNNSASDMSPDYSHDGMSIVFVSNRDGNNEIYRMNTDGTDQIRMTNDAGSDTKPSFAPDGQKVIFVTPRLGSGLRLFTMNADGSGQQVISDVPGTAFYNRPSYSPDGSKIIFVYGNDITTQTIWTADANGSNRAWAGFGRSSPAYSPDGTMVAHNCCFSPNQDSNGIWVSNVGGPMGPQLTGGQFDDFPTWQPIPTVRRTAFDFDGDGRADISFFRPAGGFWYQFRSTGGVVTPQWGLATDVLTPADYDGDLKTDIAVWRETDNNFYVLNSFDLTVRIENFGLAGDIPTGGDFDGDGKADVALYRGGAQSVFYYRGSMGNPNKNISSIPWGITGDKPVVGDYDGDGRSDPAVYRSGIWYIRQSSNGQLGAANFGLADDALIPADYDGDGKTDIAVFRSGIWYLLRTAQGFGAFQFGIAKDAPAPADYDGDGRADAAIYRDGVWWIMRSTGGVDATPFGSTGDKPIPSAFVR